MKRKHAIIFGSALLLAVAALYTIAQTPNEHSRSVQLEHEVAETIDAETKVALRIVSLNLRDLKGTERTLEDFQEIARLVEGADILVLQEVGAKGFRKNGDNTALMERLYASTQVLKSYLGESWRFVFAAHPTPEELGPSAEIPCVGFKSSTKIRSIDINWKGYFDLGEARDLGLFGVTVFSGNRKHRFTLGSAHLKPTCPERGNELIKVAEFIEQNNKENFILAGDFNWGYYSTCDNSYDGELRIMEQHKEGEVFQVFHEISYTGKGKEGAERTNLEVRKTPQMYDQFFISPKYSVRFRNGGILDKDYGIVGFSTNEYFNSRVDDIVRDQLKGVKAYMRTKGYRSRDSETKAALEVAEEEIRSNWLVYDEASFKMSDHKPIWMEIQVF